jgi:hypothetical protein
MPTAAQVRTALLNMLRSIDGTGSYTLDLSGSTYSGMEPGTGRPAGVSAFVWRGRASLTRDPAATLAGWMVERVHALTIYNIPAAQSNADREAALDVIEYDALTAIDAALSTGGALASVGVLDVTGIEIVPRFASQPGAQAQPSAVDLLLTLRYLRGR